MNCKRIVFIFCPFQANINKYLQEINVKNVDQAYGDGFWTDDLKNMSLLP